MAWDLTLVGVGTIYGVVGVLQMRNKLMKRILILIFMSMFVSPSVASIPTKLFGYNLGDLCKQDNVFFEADLEISISCATTIKQISVITVRFETISYEELKDETIQNIGSKPTTQTPNRKVIGCDQSLEKALGLEPLVDPSHHHFTGSAQWLSVQKTDVFGDPKISLHVWSSVNTGCGSGNFLSNIRLKSNEIIEKNTMLNRENANNKKKDNIGKLFN